MKKITLNICILLCFAMNQYPFVVTGDPLAATGDTFSFDVGFAAFDAGSSQSAPRLWIANNDASMNTYADTVKPYGMSIIDQYASFVTTSTPPAAIGMVSSGGATIYGYDGTNPTITNVATNPLWGATFSNFYVAGHKPIFTITSDPTSLYVTQDIQVYPEDSGQDDVTVLMKYDFGAGNNIASIFGYGTGPFFAAVSTGTFGTDPSSLVELFQNSGTVNGEAMTYMSFGAEVAIDVTTAAFKGGSSGTDLDSIGESIDINAGFNSLYVGISATAAADVGSCATGIAPVVLVPGDTPVLEFQEIAPSSLLTTGISTVISAAAGETITISNIVPMMTSTALPYLIFARNNLSDPADPVQICAVPVLTSGPDVGKIADFRSINNVFMQGLPSTFVSRSFTSVVSNLDDIDPNGSMFGQILIGNEGGSVRVGDAPVNDLYCVGDAVYAVLGDVDSPTIPFGTFKSQAIFAPDGHIISWTPWVQVLGSQLSMNYSCVDNKTISGYYVAHQNAGNYRSIVQTTFVPNSFLAPILNSASIGGFQGMFSFGEATNGFASGYTMMITTAFNQVTMGQTGTGSGYSEIVDPAEAFSLNGSDINDQQAIVAVEIAHDFADPVNHWIFVGGVSGLSVYVDENGVTWSNTEISALSDLQNGQVFRKVGDFSFIKKLFWDSSSPFIYVLTSDALYRIGLDPNKFTENPTVALNPELMIKASQLSSTPVYLLDFIIDNGFYVLGTTNGMFSGDFNVSKLPNRVTIPSGLTSASQFIILSPDVQSQHLFKSLSNLLVLNNNFGLQQARINRFAIQEGVITPLDDFLIAEPANMSVGIPTSFVTFSSYVSNYFTDGAWNLAGTYYQGRNQPSSNPITPNVLQLFAGIKSGQSSSHVILPMLTAYAPLSFLVNGVGLGGNMAGFCREATSGALVSYGSFNALANI